MPEEASLARRILRALAEDPSGEHRMSLPSLGKRLGQSASVLMRALAPMGDATLAGQGGPGWVHVVQDDGRWVAHLTAQGLAVAQALARDESRIPNADAAQTNIS